MGVDANTTSRAGPRVPEKRAATPDQRSDAPEPSFHGDLRHDTRRATKRRRAAEDALLDAVLLPNEPRNEAIGSDGQALLMKAIARLERQEDIEAAVAWSLDADGEPRVIAALPAESATRVPPERRFYDALGELVRVQRLTDSDLEPGLTALGVLGVSAAAPVPGLGTTPSAVILTYSNKAGRPLRPRSIAVLGEVANKLEKTLTTSLALERMTRLDDAIQRIDRLAALGGLVSEIVHEIRNPLVSVKTFLQLLPERISDPEFHTDFRAVVEGEVNRLERMLDDLLRHARPSPEHSPLTPDGQIAAAIETTLQLVTYRCRERGVEVETDLQDELPSLGLSEDALRQLLLNLLLNASEVTPTGGRILIKADWCQRAANHVEICVEDEGPGIAPGLRANIFEPFWTTRSDSAGGLGLSICKKIIDEAAGKIEIESGKNGGACFRVSLPISR